MISTKNSPVNGTNFIIMSHTAIFSYFKDLAMFGSPRDIFSYVRKSSTSFGNLSNDKHLTSEKMAGIFGGCM